MKYEDIEKINQENKIISKGLKKFVLEKKELVQEQDDDENEDLKIRQMKPTNKDVTGYVYGDAGGVVKCLGDWDANSGLFGIIDSSAVEDIKKNFEPNAKRKLRVMRFDYDIEQIAGAKGGFWKGSKYYAMVFVDLSTKKRPNPKDDIII